MPPLLVEGIVWPGMGPPGRGPLWPPRPVSALSAWNEGLLLSKAPCQQRGSCPDPGQCDGEVETECICPPPQREKAGASENLTRLQLAQMALPWLLTFCRCDGCLQEPARVCLPAFHPPTAPASPT